MTSTGKPTSPSRLPSATKVTASAVAALVVLLLAFAPAAKGRSLAGPIPHTAHAAAAATQSVKPEITFFPERGCGGMVNTIVGCGCVDIPVPETQGYLVSITDPSHKATFYRSKRCNGGAVAVVQQNACYCFTPSYGSVLLECSSTVANTTEVAGQANEWIK